MDHRARVAACATMMPPPAGTADTGYEFDAHENEQFRELIASMRFVAGGAMALGALLLLVIVLLATRFTLGFVAPIAGLLLVNALCLAVIGVMHRSAAASLARVCDSQGQDIPHLMDGVTRLRGLYRFLAVLLVVVAIVGVAIPMALQIVGAILALAVRS